MEGSYTWEEAWEIAVASLGYPCGCEQCLEKYGADHATQVFSLTKELSGEEFPPENWSLKWK